MTHEYYMDKLVDRPNADYIDKYKVPDDEPVTWQDLMMAIDNMGWFIDDEQSLVRKGAQWILGHVVRSLKVRIMQEKDLLKKLKN